MLFFHNLNVDPSKVSFLSPSSPSLSICSNEENQQVSPGGMKRKREKLDHLTEEEKLLRRKLKNRISAQTARDRKKEKFNNLEEKVAILMKEKKQLMDANLRLKNNNEQLEKENKELKSKLSHLSDDVSKSKELNQFDDTFESAEEPSVSQIDFTHLDKAIDSLIVNNGEECEDVLKWLYQCSQELLENDIDVTDLTDEVNSRFEEPGPIETKITKSFEKKNRQDLEIKRNSITFDHHYHKKPYDEKNYSLVDNSCSNPLIDLDIPSIPNFDELFTELL